MVEWEYLVKADPGNAPMFSPPMDGDIFEDEIDEIEKNAKALMRIAKMYAGHDKSDIDNLYDEILNSLNQLLTIYNK
tara:strand:+ start:233 stop:463 length:231 start_codon:yes stop_codon:yes gene_type:complete